jgi:hypothetical protein
VRGGRGGHWEQPTMARDGSGGQGRGERDRPERDEPPSGVDHARVLALSSALVVMLFLAHVLVLVLVDPLKILHLSKLNAYAVSSVPLAMALVFAVDAIESFLRLEARTAWHLAWFLLVVLFGSFSVHGLFGFILYLVRHPPAF